MHKKYTPARRDGFTKYRARHARHTLLLLPPAKRRALQRNLIFIGMTLGLVFVVALISKAQAAGGACRACCPPASADIHRQGKTGLQPDRGKGLAQSPVLCCPVCASRGEGQPLPGLRR